MPKKKTNKKVGRKFDGGKAPLNLHSTYALEELAQVLDFGAKKYDAWNWSYGMKYSRVISAAKRHIAKWENRQDKDFGEDCKPCQKNKACKDHSQRHHLANAMCNLMFLLDYEIRGLTELDDRRPLATQKRKK